jgi:predicted NAD/FAD-binding protein
MTDGKSPQDRASVSYHLNRLQGLQEEREYMVTLNPEHEPAPESVVRRMDYAHPVYNADSVATQADLPHLNGHKRTHFCGAYFANGFHEDGLNSAIAVADDLGVVF